MSHVTSADNDTDRAVTVVISRRVKPGSEAEFEKLSIAMSMAATKFPGHLGSNMFRPATAEDPEYRIVFKFRTQEDLEHWQNSSVRLAHLDSFEKLLVAPAKTEVLSGMVTWFTLPTQNPVKPPPKYKMTVVSWLALYPTVSIIFFSVRWST